MSGTKFIITVTMESGDVWETIRHTKDGMQTVLDSIFACGGFVKFSVEEKVYG